MNEGLAALSSEQASTPVKGIPLVPPRPNRFSTSHASKRDSLVYTRFVHAIQDICRKEAQSFMVTRPKDLLKGSDILWGILDEELCHLAYPSFDEILFIEDAFVMKTLDRLVKGNAITTTEFFRREYQLTHPEIHALIASARTSARAMTEFDQEEQRAIMVLKLQDHQRRARTQFNMREELQSLKQEALVIGLTKTSPAGFEDIFGKVVDMASSKPRELTASSPYSPPAQSAIEDTEEQPEQE